MKIEDIPVGGTKISNAWLVTFTDLVSLLLAFFVLLFSMSKVKVDKWEAVVEALSLRLNPVKEVIEPQPTARLTVPIVDPPKGRNLDYLMAVLRTRMEEDPVLRQGIVRRTEGRLYISLAADLVFAPGSVEVVQSAWNALFILGGILQRVDNEIDVYGHSDPAPVSGEVFTSNWELSLGRAVAVADALRHVGYTGSVRAFGFADTRFGDLPVGLTKEQRYTFARRVDIVVRPTREDGR